MDTKRILRFIGSKWFFYLVVVGLILQAGWIALSGRYPMAFDENFHLGIIKLYAHHLSPFWNGQTPATDALGPVTRDPSYFYQWLMSFPYRLGGSITALRLINIGLFAAALPLYRRLLLKTGASRALVHFCLALFVLVPVVPLLAAQINYDNLLLPLTALALLLTLNFDEQLARRRLNLTALLELALVVSLSCLTKYAFLPIALAIAVYLLVRLGRTYGSRRGGLVHSLKTTWLLILLVVGAFGLLAERYGVNLLRYHQPVPSCEQVLSERQCSQYGPWQRDHQYTLHKPSNATTSPLVFNADWFYSMWLRLFFAVDGPTTQFQTRGPLIMPGMGAIGFASAALVATLASLRPLWRRYDGRVLWLFAGVMAAYVAALWLDEYRSFLRTGQPVALNGRYLLPVLPLLMVILALGTTVYLKSRLKLKMTLAAAVLLSMLWGGGALTYILRSNDAWYWSNSPLKGANQTIRSAIGPVVPGYYSPTEFMGRHGT